MLYNPNDIYIGRSLDLYGESSEGEMSLFFQLINPSSVVLDVGANIGTHALCMARAAGAGGFVLAFEPQRFLFQTLCANMALNGVTNAFCYNTAVGEVQGSVTIPAFDYGVENNFAGFSIDPEYSGQGEQTGILTIDSLNLQKCHFIKIDVEGMEIEVLKGAKETIEQFRPLLYLENDRREKSGELIEHLQSAGFKLFWHCPPLFNPVNYYQNSDNVFENTVSVNMLCIPSEADFRLNGLREVTGPDDWYLPES